MQNPLIDPKTGAVDLARVEALAEARRAVEQHKELEAQQAELIAWERAMRKTFKSVFPTWKRRIFIRAAAQKLRREESA